MQMMGEKGPTHLVALYVATAGLQGNVLGSDEEEITLLVYVLIDALQNKVNDLLFTQNIIYYFFIFRFLSKKKTTNNVFKNKLICFFGLYFYLYCYFYLEKLCLLLLLRIDSIKYIFNFIYLGIFIFF